MKCTSYADAILAARAAFPDQFVEDRWNHRPADAGLEDSTHYLIVFDEIDDEIGVMFGCPHVLVRKADAHVELVNMLEIIDKVREMTASS